MRSTTRQVDPTFCATHVATPLLGGGLVYLVFRSPDLLVFRWIEALGGLPALLGLRAMLEPTSQALPSWVLYSLPDGLWVYAFMSFMLHLWRGARPGPRRFWAAMGPALGMGWEAGQWLGLTPGTFDVMDVALMAVMACIALLLHGTPEGLGSGHAQTVEP